jgi:hypothetical protein
LIFRLRLRSQSEELAAATAGRMCSGHAQERKRTVAVKQHFDANTYVHVFEAKIPTKYMHIRKGTYQICQ